MRDTLLAKQRLFLPERPLLCFPRGLNQDLGSATCLTDSVTRRNSWGTFGQAGDGVGAGRGGRDHARRGCCAAVASLGAAILG